MQKQTSYVLIMAASIYLYSYSMQEGQLLLGNDNWASVPTEIITHHIMNITQEIPRLALQDMINMGRCARVLYQKTQPIITEYLGCKHIALRRRLVNEEKVCMQDYIAVVNEIFKKPWYKSYVDHNTTVLNPLEVGKSIHIYWPTDPYRLFDLSKKTLLHCAVASIENTNSKLYENKLKIVSYLTEKYPSTINLQDGGGNTPLMCSTNLDVHRLLNDRTDLSLRNRENLTAYEKILKQPGIDTTAFTQLYTKSLPLISEESKEEDNDNDDSERSNTKQLRLL